MIIVKGKNKYKYDILVEINEVSDLVKFIKFVHFNANMDPYSTLYFLTIIKIVLISLLVFSFFYNLLSTKNKSLGLFVFLLVFYLLAGMYENEIHLELGSALARIDFLLRLYSDRGMLQADYAIVILMTELLGRSTKTILYLYKLP